jgi:hypothetical protein
MHIQEIVFNLLQLTPKEGRRCDPPPHTSVVAPEDKVNIEALRKEGRLHINVNL